ncbi:hypothetical protein K431DRAFT_288773 [Polychaeton citri CBS 116435]|uniref:Uncharacterized protein n=1 Tax=Polychaeton citri CBS 116435 TaxID=1314669 RepID=A0A9P4PZX6_9PEZI|nr:hypothetical protein K431DRAFT_288773 [Polychaeton citri CBS 116435]
MVEEMEATDPYTAIPGLLRIPTEIRLQIYSHLFLPTAFERPADGCADHITTRIHLHRPHDSNRRKDGVSQSPGEELFQQALILLQVSRVLRGELQDVFFSENTFVLLSPLAFVPGNQRGRMDSYWAVPLTTSDDLYHQLKRDDPEYPRSLNGVLQDNYVPQSILRFIRKAVLITSLSMPWQDAPDSRQRFIESGLKRRVGSQIVEMQPWQCMTLLRSLRVYLNCSPCYHDFLIEIERGPKGEWNGNHYQHGMRPVQALLEALPPACKVVFNTFQMLKVHDSATYNAWRYPFEPDHCTRRTQSDIVVSWLQSRDPHEGQQSCHQGKTHGSDFDHRQCGSTYWAARVCPVAIRGVTTGCIHALIRLRADNQMRAEMLGQTMHKSKRSRNMQRYKTLMLWSSEMFPPGSSGFHDL